MARNRNSTTPAYRIEMTVSRGYSTPSAWRREYGRPTDANLAKWAAMLDASTQPGGCNAHLGGMVVETATLIRQSDNTTVARYQRAAALEMREAA